jgi:uncharacterized membrane protein (DUF485 family)
MSLPLKERWSVLLSRLLPYWLTVFAASWTLAFLYIWTSTDAYERYDAKVKKVSA